MPAFSPSHNTLRAFLSLILLIANVAAPFRAPNGRSLLRCPRQSDTTRSVARVRIVTHPGALNGFRAVAGFAKGKLEGTPPLHTYGQFSRLPHSSPTAAHFSCLNQVETSPLPPLRC